MAVFTYHLDYRWLPGGFLGVDVFFVLSGYLITSLLLVERQHTGRVDLALFWLRRAKRLLPALLILLVGVAWWISAHAPPFEMPLRRRDLLWTLFYGANWHFVATGQDYFAQFASASPLRHAWSLAIEEQFYLAWPLIVAGTLALARRPRLALAMVCGIGLVASTTAMAFVFDPGNPSRAYFGTDARIHQPLIGALLAVLLSRRVEWQRGIAGRVAGVVGALALLIAATGLSDDAAAYYFGLSTGLAFAAAAMILGLESAPDGPLSRLLSWRPVRWIGEISYGLYLWHWPVILAVTTAPAVFHALPLSTAVNLTRVLATFALAAASFYTLEQPVRRGRLPLIGQSPRRFAVAAAGSVLVVAGLTAWATQSDMPETAALMEIPGCPSPIVTPCVRQEGGPGAPVVAIIGDSIARSLDPAFVALARRHGWTYVMAAQNACRITHLLTSQAGQVRPYDRECYESTPRLFEQLLALNPTTIVSLDRWEIIDFVDANGRVHQTGTAEHVALTEQALRDVTRQLTAGGARLAFVELPPVLPAGCLGPDAPATGCQVFAADDPLHAPYNAIYRRLASTETRVSTVSLTDAICPRGRCRPEVNGIPIRFDGLHFTPYASEWLAPEIFSKLSQALEP